MSRYEWDFFMVVFLATDRVQHFFWKYIDPKHPQYNKRRFSSQDNPIFRIYEKMDTVIGRLRKIAGNNVTTVIVSDHGFGPVYKFVSINDWLLSNGYMSLKNNSFNTKLAGNFLKKLTPRPIRSKIKHLLRKNSEKNGTETMELFQNVDWSKTIAFSEGVSARIFINTPSLNFGAATENKKDYNKIRERLILELMNLKDPDNGEKVVERILKKEDVFKDIALENAPDLLIEFKSGYTSSRVTFEDLQIIKPSWNNKIIRAHKDMSGDHEKNGILIMHGNYIKKGLELSGASML
jgi:predicted AlkP superfamily phosphohydrolase/phosphomutase